MLGFPAHPTGASAASCGSHHSQGGHQPTVWPGDKWRDVHRVHERPRARYELRASSPKLHPTTYRVRRDGIDSNRPLVCPYFSKLHHIPVGATHRNRRLLLLLLLLLLPPPRPRWRPPPKAPV